MNIDQAIRQAAKLLKLAEHANTSPEEAATAAAKAQELMTRFKIEHIIAQESTIQAEPEETIVDFAKKGAHLEDENEQKISRWKSSLAMAIADANQCKVYYSHKTSQRFGDLYERRTATLELIGRPSDADAVRYLYSYLSKEVDRLAGIHGKGCGRTWCNNFRLGIVDTIRARLHEQKKATAEAIRKEAQAVQNTMALVKVDTALATLDRRAKEVETFGRVVVGLRKRNGGSGGRHDHNARSAGREAGKGIALGAKAGLRSGAKALKS